MKIDLTQALIRIIALSVADGDKIKAEEYVNWANNADTERNTHADIVDSATRSFCRRYLSVRGIPSERKIWKFVDDFERGRFDDTIDFAKVGIKIRRMKYGDFLKTPYWIAIAELIKFNKKKCQMCGSTKALEVHHTTYEHHGNELNHMEDLVCLCHDCHAQIHNKQ